VHNNDFAIGSEVEVYEERSGQGNFSEQGMSENHSRAKFLICLTVQLDFYFGKKEALPPSRPSAPSLTACAMEMMEFSGHCSEAPLKKAKAYKAKGKGFVVVVERR
jgi:hypothetical protein